MKRTLMSAAIVAAALAAGAQVATAAESLSVLHWWTSGGESKAIRVLKDDMNKQGYEWKDFAVAGGAGAAATEEILQMAACQPPFVLRYATSGADILLDWDAKELPDALLWLSNGGRKSAPWCGNHFALGVEPANSFFDLSRVVIPPANHPLANRSGLRFLVDKPRTFRYRLSAEAI